MGEPVAGVITTLAWAMAAPEGSVTCPRRAPEGACAGEAVCADNATSDEKNKNATAIKRMYFSTFTFLLCLASLKPGLKPALTLLSSRGA
jgi:hypothetical protein